MKRILLCALFGLLPAAVVAQNYDGRLDYADCGALWGWAWDSTQPNTPISIDLYNGYWTRIATLPANQYRADLQSIGIGNGYHGFSIATPAFLKDGQPHTLYARPTGTGLDLPHSGSTSFNCPAGSTGYQYYFTDTFPSGVIGSYWHQNGALTTGSGPGGAGLGGGGNGGNLISTLTPPGAANAYEVKMTLNLTTSGGYYEAMLRASNDALVQVGPSYGTTYDVEIANPTFSGSSCAAGLSVFKIVNGNVWLLASSQVPCRNGMVVRAIMTVNNSIVVWIDGAEYLAIPDSDIAAGKPGVGVAQVPAGNSIASIEIGPADQTAPSVIPASSIGVTALSNEVNLQWQGSVDDPNGTGVAYTNVTRDDVTLAWEPGTTFADTTVSQNTTYKYGLLSTDYHGNVQATYINVRTPPANTIDGRQVGVRPTGSYWGGAGENIDMRSGNLNFSIPLLNVKGRGWTVPFNLSYNSQMWRQDPAGSFKLGRDAGFGYGWKLQGGSLMPVYAGWLNLHHYLFVDASGAEYRLTDNNGGIWTSRESIYIEYDSNTGRMYFPDGTFWLFGCTSNGTEEDSGVQYPTLIQDTNGNQVTIAYQAGQGDPIVNSSGRMLTIHDVMGSYNFVYTTGFPHLTSITSSYPAENYTFGYTASSNLLSPFSGASFGLAQMLHTATNTNTSMTTTFSYGANSTGELSQATFPYGGYLRWEYGNMGYFATNITQREVQTRYLAMSSGAAELAYPFSHDQYDSSRQFHLLTAVDDPGGQGEKAWSFSFTSGAGFGLQLAYEQRQRTPTLVPKTHIDSFWALDSLSRPYLSTAKTTLDPGTGWQVQKRTDQAVDQYGNVTSMSLYDYGALSSPASPTRVYMNSYLTGSAYSAAHIRNRLTGSVVTQGLNTATLVSNTYDSYSPSICGSYGYVNTPQGWQWANTVTSIDPANISNIYRGNVTGSFGLDMYHTLCYATTGAVVMRIDGGHTTTSATNGTTNYTALSAITTGSLTTNMTWTGSLGLASQSSPNGDGIGIGYDTAGRPSTSTSPYGATTTYSHSVSPPRTYATVIPDSNTPRLTQTNLDGFGRAVEVDSVDSHWNQYSIVQMQYAASGCSPLGKLWRQSQPYAPGATIYWTTNYYDGLGRTTSVVAPDGASTTTYAYAGNTVTVTDPAGKWKKFTMDAFGNLTSVVEPDATQTTTSGLATTSYTYDALNHLILVTMPRQMPGGNPVTQYRTFNYLVGSSITAYLRSATNPENGIVSYTYNPDGTLATKLDAKGQTLKYAYDSYGRVLTISLAGSPDTVLRTYTYDTNSADPTYSAYSLGRLTTVQYGVPSTSTGTNASGQPIYFSGDTVTEMYSYTRPGQVAGKRLRVARQPNGGGQALINDLNATWAFNNEGHLTGVSYPGDRNGAGLSYFYTYDDMGRLNKMTDSEGNGEVAGTQYNAAGQVTLMAGPGLGSRSYNGMGQLTNVNSGAVNITYNYSATQNNGKILSQTDNLSGEQVTYAYDSLNRLNTAQGSGWNQSFVYDPFGNLTDKNGTNSWHGMPESTTNRLLPADANGNWNSNGTHYDAENRMISLVGTNNASQQYAYDGQNKRVWAATWDSTNSFYTSETYYFYSPQGKLMAQFTPSVQSGVFGFQNVGTRAYFGGRLLGAEDRLGSRGSFFPYGEERTNPPAFNDTVKFATYTRDSVSGLDYADQRYYASSAGRFMSPDPYRASNGGSGDPGNPTTWNRYAYAISDPVNGNDPEGLKVQDCDWEGGCFNPTSTSISYVGGYYIGGISWIGTLWAIHSELEKQYNTNLSGAIGWSADSPAAYILQYAQSDSRVQEGMRELALLQSDNSYSNSCSSYLSSVGLSVNAIETAAAMANVYDQNSPTARSLSQSDFSPYAYPGTTMDQWKSIFGATTSPSLGIIFINNLDPDPGVSAKDLIFHELLHIVTKAGDDQTMAARLNVPPSLSLGPLMAGFLRGMGCP